MRKIFFPKRIRRLAIISSFNPCSAILGLMVGSMVKTLICQFIWVVKKNYIPLVIIPGHTIDNKQIHWVIGFQYDRLLLWLSQSLAGFDLEHFWSFWLWM